MKVKDYGRGIYILFKGILEAQMKQYEGWRHIGWTPVIINQVILRATERGGYYIIKGNFERRDAINDFKVGNKSLKSYLNEAR